MKTLITTPLTIAEPNPATSESYLIKNQDGKYRIPKGVCKELLYQLVIELYEEDFKRDVQFSNPNHAKQYLHLKLAHLEHETFSLVYLDNQHQVIAIEELFAGTIDAAAVYPREIVKRCLEVNAAAIVLCHNHPSGIPEPSNADKTITKQIKNALDTVDIRIIDHIVIGGAKSTSFAERGLL
jgi:DNA repair protein RadC